MPISDILPKLFLLIYRLVTELCDLYPGLFSIYESFRSWFSKYVSFYRMLANYEFILLLTNIFNPYMYFFMKIFRIRDYLIFEMNWVKFSKKLENYFLWEIIG